MSNPFRILCLGDVVARPGRSVLKRALPKLREKYQTDFIVVNGENAAGGTGIDPGSAEEIRNAGVDVVTLGDHTWRKREIRPFLDGADCGCVRPGNYGPSAHGSGTIVVEKGGLQVGVMNLLGRTFMNLPLDCPFRTAEMYLEGVFAECDLIVCDFHAEATSEKYAFARYFDGRIHLIVGTHTHVATADEQILGKGSGYVTDLGMCGCTEGVIGLDSGTAISRFLSGVPESYKVAKGHVMATGIVADFDSSTGAITSIERVRFEP